MKQKIISLQQAADMIHDGMSVMVGGFLACGTPNLLIDALVKKQVKHLTIIGDDCAYPGVGVGKLFDNGQVDSVICGHIGTNPVVGKQMLSGVCDVDLIPQGTLAERIRCAGSGLGGVLTPVGVGTVVQVGKKVITIDGKDYLLEKPLRADVALLSAHTVDRQGNLWFRRSTRNYQPLMATAADLVIVQAEHIVEVGEIQPENVHTPSLFVDFIVDGGVK